MAFPAGRIAVRCQLMPPRLTPRTGGPLSFGLFPERAVDLFIERRAASRVLAQRMVLAPHQVRAVGERAAGPRAVKLAIFLQAEREVGLRESPAADPRQRDRAIGDIRGCRVR